MLQGLRLSDATEWVAQSLFYKIENAECYLTIYLDPIAEIFNELALERRLTRPFCLIGRVTFLLQDRPHGEVRRSTSF